MVDALYIVFERVINKQRLHLDYFGVLEEILMEDKVLRVLLLQRTVRKGVRAQTHNVKENKIYYNTTRHENTKGK